MNATDQLLRNELQQQLVGIDFHILMEDSGSSLEADSIRLVIQIKEDEVETSAFGILFTLSALSFRDARPLETSDAQFNKNDEWTIHDFMKHLSFAYGKLQFYALYVRGRVVNTDITLSSDGLMVIQTYHRGKSASRWIASLQGKNPLSVQSRNFLVVRDGNRTTLNTSVTKCDGLSTLSPDSESLKT